MNHVAIGAVTIPNNTNPINIKIMLNNLPAGVIGTISTEPTVVTVGITYQNESYKLWISIFTGLSTMYKRIYQRIWWILKLLYYNEDGIFLRIQRTILESC